MAATFTPTAAVPATNRLLVHPSRPSLPTSARKSCRRRAMARFPDVALRSGVEPGTLLTGADYWLGSKRRWAAFMRFRKLYPAAIAAIVGAAVVFSAWFVFFREAAFVEESEKSSLSQGLHDASAPAQEENSRSPRPGSGSDENPGPTELPPLNAPLSSIIDELEERANAGEPDAACRLAAEFSYCNQLRFWEAEDSRWLTQRLRALEAIDDSHVRNQALAAADQELESRSVRSEGLRGHCDGVAIPDLQLISDNWRRAAILGSTPAMKQYSSGNSFRWNEILDSIPRLALYREEAEGIALAVAKAGDLEMRMALAAGYSSEPRDRRNLLSQALKPDQAMSLAIYEQLEYDLAAVGDSDLRLVQVRTEVESLLEHARQLASEDDEIRAQTLRARSFSEWMPLDDSMATNQVAGGPSISDISRAQCSEP